MTKNTGIEENQLSTLDLGSCVKDAHNDALHATDVNIINSFVPERYSRVEYTLKDMGDGTQEVEFVDFFYNGVNEVTEFILRDTFQGTAEITTFPFTSSTPGGLDGTYLTIYDDVGSVGVWFDLDDGSTPPITGAARDIEVDIVTGDSPSDLATKFVSTMNSDSKFSGTTITSLAVIQSSTIGNKTDATSGTSGITPAITDGTETINSQYFLLNSAQDVTEYYIWFNLDSTGTDPALSGKTGIEVGFTSSTTYAELNQGVAAAITALEDFSASTDDICVTVTNTAVGDTTNASGGNSGTTATVRTDGEDPERVARVQVFFDSNNFITAIERIS